VSLEVVDFLSHGLALMASEGLECRAHFLKAVDDIQRAMPASFEPLKKGTDPLFGGHRVLAMQFTGQIPEVLLNMVKVDTLNGAFETISG